MKKSVLAAALWLSAAVAPGTATDRIDLGGTWRFAIDPVGRGEQNGWQKPGLVVRDWTEVEIPHCWTVDPRFPYVGTAWYRRTFSLPRGAAGQHARITFDRVFYKARVWINGQLAGEHEGGYTPFQVDATAWIRAEGENTLAVQVDNSWNTATLPGARIGIRPQEQVYPWREYGGILEPAALLLSGPAFLSRLRVIAVPNLADGTAWLVLTAHTSNASDRPMNVRVGFAIDRDKQPVEAWQLNAALAVDAALPPRSVTPVRAQILLRRDQVRLWDVDHPNLYALRVTLLEGGRETDSGGATFGIRKIETKAGQLLLNGEPIRMGGGNRHSDHPKYGSMDPEEVVEADMRQMKRANMELMRISHYPVSPRILDWADRSGMLIIEEGLNWQLTEQQMDSAAIRANFQSQMREMVERDWNHPSVIGWSVGNEYPSYAPAGRRWTKDMIEWTRTLDNTRLLTFVSNHAFSEKFTRADEEGSRYVDLVCVNIYDNLAGRLDLVHKRWPDKPVLVSEYGYRADAVDGDEARNAAHRKAVEIFRERPYVVGASVWTYNDYRSRYPPGTDLRGYRQWGVVGADRTPKPTYALLAAEYSPVLIRDARVESGTVLAAIQARRDFPSYTLHGYSAKVELLDSAGTVLASSTTPLPVLRPGETYALKAAARAPAARARIEVVRPTGFVTASMEVVI